ncbi:MAG: phosphoribosylformylglycinamidine synthase subunit PurQ [Alphaproteobacteria bacterium]|nr:phosphoribosylformylglycinamidine synthase subunit PurQ [Alphaproteobacteria bacterium]
MEAAIISFPGSNRERDAAMVLERVSGRKPKIVFHTETELPKTDLILLPGGFSYGDYLRTGAMAAHSPVMREVIARAKSGVRVLGICNGFQILCETGLLPGILLRNAHMKFNCRLVTLRVENNRSDFTRNYKHAQEFKTPVAHGDGNYFAPPDTVKKLEDNGQIAFRYVDNPNGSVQDIAGIMNEKLTVLGMMPHPENASEPLHGQDDGKVLFESICQSMAA